MAGHQHREGEPQQDKKNASQGLGIALGLMLGAAVGVALDNVAIGISLGFFFGVVYEGLSNRS